MKKEELVPNTIYYTTNFDVLSEVVKKLDEVKKNDILASEFIQRLSRYLLNKIGMVLVSFNEAKKLNGCLVVSKHEDKSGEYLWIDFSWIDPRCPDLAKKFDKEVVEACRLKGIKRIQARMNRGFKAMYKLYGAYEVARVLERKVI